MNTYRIVEDRTIDYGDEDQLYVMIIKHNDRYILRIDSRSVRVGDRFVRDMKVGRIVVEQLVQSLPKYKNIYSAFNVLDLAFSLNSLKAFMFMVNVQVKRYSLDDIFQMRRLYSYQVNTKWCENNEIEPLKADAVEVLFDGYVEPLGVFIPDDNKTKYTFQLNEPFVFMNRWCK